MARARHSNILTITAVMTDTTGHDITGIVMPYVPYGSMDRSVNCSIILELCHITLTCAYQKEIM